MRSEDALGLVLSHLRLRGHLTLFLDYDGTLVPIAPTPEEAVPDAPLLNLLTRLAQHRLIRTVILSGRRLEDLRRMLPIDGLILAGVYGVELSIGGRLLDRQPPADGNRSMLERLQAGWSRLAAGLPGFLLENKGNALALHARWANAEDARHVLPAARDLATDLISSGSFRLLDGDRFLEVAPAAADKGATVEWVLSHFPIDDDLPVAFGDDNKDDAAFAAVRRHDGLAVGVDHRYPLPEATVHVDSCEDVRRWLAAFLSAAPRDALPHPDGH